MDKEKLENNQSSKNPFSVIEEDVLNFWDKNEIFKKSIEKEAPKGNYIFNDGPPFITGLPHYATLLPSIAKDVIPRYWTMKGYRVERIWGWDCHGLPAENKVEEELGLKNKKDIEELGVDKFIDACRSYVNKGSEQWEWYINRIGRWVDMKNAYRTMDLKFMESVIWSFKKLYDEGFIYEGYRTSLHCPRCATPLSKFEITMDAGSYKDVTDKTAIVKFKIIDNNKIENNTYILAWTTTPWTLPGNLALAINKNINYIKLQIINNELEKNNFYILAEERITDVLKDKNYKIVEKFKGEKLINLQYEPIYKINNNEIIKSKKVYKIYHGDFVTTEDGTGVVHIAPNFGEDDFELGKKVDLPMIDLMDENGIYSEAMEKWNGYYFKKANRDVLLDLEKENIIFSISDYTHSYPFCYRCNTPLIYKTQKAWYLNIQKIKEKMLKTNEEINWVPEYFKEGRFKNNIESAPDWCLSRSRYWGSPIPVWRCSNCNKIKVLGSIEEIEKLSGKKVKDLHRPDIDEHELKCECGNTMERVKEVFDCWFESGAMPFAQFHYPFEKQNDFKNLFPADFIIEYTGQLRGWFYYLHVLSNALFDSISFKNVIVSGVLAGADGRKMSKSFGNYPDPRATLEKYGSDALRMYFMNSQIMLGNDTSLSEIEIQDALRKNVIVFWNVVKFYELFAHNLEEETLLNDTKNILDQWILIKLNQLIKKVTENLEKYNLPEASRPISEFIDDLSTWYLRRSRDRFKGEDEKDKQAALITTNYVLTQLSKIMAPFTPFIAEQIWQKVSGYNFIDENKSVHLESWPQVESGIRNQELGVLEEMLVVRKIVELGLAKRDEAGIKIRQTLEKFSIFNFQFSINEDYLKLIKDELNVKNIVCKKGDGDMLVELDTNITPELKLEGLKREIVRQVNMMRKQAGFTIEDKIILSWQSESDLIKQVIEKMGDEIKKDTLSEKIINNDVEEKKEINLNGEKIMLGMVCQK
ncbi:isoleucine--tRNA ligase [Patescibacteria group bacterium]|nr:isoleucine--tRNA ligase [Patescibacteria group bacterium]MBU0879405.1 isoleucine--tRNA ligase [Patescibacteria group bacterium]MBU0897733.1 isoleucine--tRNA ligase [Patescibacteria group bacterium]